MTAHRAIGPIIALLLVQSTLACDSLSLTGKTFSSLQYSIDCGDYRSVSPLRKNRDLSLVFNSTQPSAEAFRKSRSHTRASGVFTGCGAVCLGLGVAGILTGNYRLSCVTLSLSIPFFLTTATTTVRAKYRLRESVDLYNDSR